MKIFKKIVCAAVAFAVMSVFVLTASATEYNRWTQAKYLTKDELFESTWESILSSHGTYEEKLTGNTLELSYTYEELKKFVNDFQVPEDIDFQVQDMPDAFEDYMEEKNGDIVVEPYSKKVIEYLTSHPNSDLDWTIRTHSSDSESGAGYVEYICYDKSNLVDSYTSKDTNNYMQYSEDDVSNILLWTYDEESDKYICKNQNGKIVNSVAKYHLEGETSSGTVSASSEAAISSQTSSMIDDKPVTASSPAVPDSPSAEEQPATASGDDTPTTTAEPVPVGPGVTDNVSNSPSTTQIILIVIGVLIIAGIIVIIVMLNKKKRE